MRPIAVLGMDHLTAHQVDHWNHLEGRFGRGIVRIHVFESIGAGPGHGAAVETSLLREGDLMAGALLADLLELPAIALSYARDARLAPLTFGRPPRSPPAAVRVCWREPGEDPRAALEREMQAADAVWPIAPEAGGELQRAAQAVLDAGRVLIGALPAAIAGAASKHETSRRLRQAGIAAVPSFRAGEPLEPAARPDGGAWVVKPDDGAGCLRTRVFGGLAAARAALEALGTGFVAQPWIPGPAMSLAAIGGPAGVQLLSVNRQRVDACDGWLTLRAVEVNAAAASQSLAALAGRVASALPGLSGFFGIDYIDAAAGPVVIEVNPRLTTSYAGLRPALGINAAHYVLAAAGIASAPSGAPGPGGRDRSRPFRVALGGAASGAAAGPVGPDGRGGHG
jgi:predicted ATP-grasp superfamily ATP-dependent carboligase